MRPLRVHLQPREGAPAASGKGPPPTQEHLLLYRREGLILRRLTCPEALRGLGPSALTFCPGSTGTSPDGGRGLTDTESDDPLPSCTIASGCCTRCPEAECSEPHTSISQSPGGWKPEVRVPARSGSWVRPSSWFAEGHLLPVASWGRERASWLFLGGQGSRSWGPHPHD